MEVRNLIALLALVLALPSFGARLIVTTAVYGQVGQLKSVDLDAAKVSPRAMPIHSDAIVRAPLGDGSIYVVNRLGGDNIQVVTKDLARTVRQFSVGRGLNAQDIAVVRPDFAYVSRLNSGKLLKVNPATGATLGEGPDLSAYAYADGVPQMARMLYDGHRVLLQLQRLNAKAGFTPTDYSMIAEINPANDTVTRTAKLTFTNPVSDIRTLGARIFVGGVGKWTKADGGIEELDPTSLATIRRVIDEAELGGDLLDFDILSEHVGVAIISTPATKVVSFDPATGKRLGVVADGKGYDFMQLTGDVARGVFYLVDRDARQPAVRTFDARTLNELTDRRWAMKLPPFQMVVTD